MRAVAVYTPKSILVRPPPSPPHTLNTTTRSLAQDDHTGITAWGGGGGGGGSLVTAEPGDLRGLSGGLYGECAQLRAAGAHE